jgi:hypothetical protein
VLVRPSAVRPAALRRPVPPPLRQRGPVVRPSVGCAPETGSRPSTPHSASATGALYRSVAECNLRRVRRRTQCRTTHRPGPTMTAWTASSAQTGQRSTVNIKPFLQSRHLQRRTTHRRPRSQQSNLCRRRGPRGLPRLRSDTRSRRELAVDQQPRQPRPRRTGRPPLRRPHPPRSGGDRREVGGCRDQQPVHALGGR